MPACVRLCVRACLLHPNDPSPPRTPLCCLTAAPCLQLSVNMWVNALNLPGYLSGSAELKVSPVEDRGLPAALCPAFDVKSPGRAAAAAAAESLNFSLLCSITFKWSRISQRAGLSRVDAAGTTGGFVA